MTRTAHDVVAAAAEFADEVLFPDAMRVDRLDVLPAVHLDALAAAGLAVAFVEVTACRDCPLRACVTVIRPTEHVS